MPDPKPHHRRAAAEALLSETGMKYAQLEHPEHLVRWYEDADSVPLTRVMGYRHEAFARTAQAIADAEEQSEAKLQTLRAESLRIAAELLRLSGTDVFGVEMLLRTHVVELAMKLKEACLAAGEQPGRLTGGGK